MHGRRHGVKCLGGSVVGARLTQGCVLVIRGEVTEPLLQDVGPCVSKLEALHLNSNANLPRTSHRARGCCSKLYQVHCGVIE